MTFSESLTENGTDLPVGVVLPVQHNPPMNNHLQRAV